MKMSGKKKILIFDSGSIINFSMNGLLEVFENLKKQFNGKFIITSQVESEIIKRPLKIKKYKLGALKIKKLLGENILELPSDIGIKDSVIEEKSKKMLNLANRIFFVKNKYMHLIDKGESSCLALSEILNEKNIKNLIVIDERTTRMLCENPENLHKLLETKLHTKIKIKKEKFPYFSKFKFIRSCELIYIAYKKKLIELKGKEVLDALLYAVKYKGCSVSKREIEEIKRM